MILFLWECSKLNVYISNNMQITSIDWCSFSWLRRGWCLLSIVTGFFWGGSRETSDETEWLLGGDEPCSFSHSSLFPDSAGASISGDAARGPRAAPLVLETSTGATLEVGLLLRGLRWAAGTGQRQGWHDATASPCLSKDARKRHEHVTMYLSHFVTVYECSCSSIYLFECASASSWHAVPAK